MFKNKLRFDRNEIAGAFGDIGTDLPLIIGMILASGIDSASTLLMFGAMQIFTALVYGIPMPAQPLKAVATIVIAQKIGGDVIYGGGLAIGLVMFLLSITGLLTKLAEIIPKAVIRGVQLGLGLTLAATASKQYICAENSLNAYILASIAFIITLLFFGNRKFPPAIFIIAIGVLYGLIFSIDKPLEVFSNISVHIPVLHQPGWDDVLTGFLILALPQIPLSLGNSVLATKQIVKDLFPEKNISVKKIGITYSIMNFINPFFSGIPVCHGSGGMMGHYAFGARTGGSVFIYGLLFITVGLLFSHNFETVVKIFPLQILGVILFFEALSLILLIKDVASDKKDLFIAILTGLIAFGIPYGFLIGMITGTLLYYYFDKLPAKNKGA